MPEQAPSFPNFCRPGNLFAVFLIAELIVLVLTLSPDRIEGFDWRRLALLSLFAQLLALWVAGLLCILGPRLAELHRALGVSLAYAIILAVVFCGTWAAVWLDSSVALGVLPPGTPPHSVVLGNVLVGGLVGAAALRYFFVQLAWRRQVERAADARLQALQARIRPHFLFNALNTIASVIRRDPAAAERAVEDLSDLFRASLAKGEGTWSFGEEVAICKRYAAIERLRLGDRLAIDWDVDAIPSATTLPALVVQPLLENAIQHGIQALREGGTVTVRGTFDDKTRTAVLVIINPVAAQAPPNRSGTGLALENIRQRLMLRYASRATLDARRESGQFVAMLRWPTQAPPGSAGNESSHR
ncbi:MAG: histidine kinase [Pseudomonadota bacterium]